MCTSEFLLPSALNAVIELTSPLVLFSPSPDVSLVQRLALWKSVDRPSI